jgi:hypothetical protein
MAIALTILNTAIKFLNPLFPNYKNLHKYWWHWFFVVLAIILSFIALVWAIGVVVLSLALRSWITDWGRFFVEYLTLHIAVSVGLGIILPAVLYRVLLIILGISGESGSPRPTLPGRSISNP